ncbi:MAG: hypothetical protein GXO22_04335 [Aquificae bacterium]|nr:hypothetical protein [Aquificota bacterium]
MNLQDFIKVGTAYITNLNNAFYPENVKDLKKYLEHISEPKTIVINSKIDLEGESLDLHSSELVFISGGMLDNGIIKNAKIKAGLFQIFGENLTVSNIDAEQVYPQWFGAVGDGTNDDTQAFQKAINLKNTVYIPKPPVYYVVSSLNIPPHTQMIGEYIDRSPYAPLNLAYFEKLVALVRPAGQTAPMLNIENAVTIKNLIFVGRDKAGDFLETPANSTSYGKHMHFENVYIYWFKKGFGTSNYLRNSRFINCKATYCDEGFKNLIDCRVINAEVNACVRGVVQGVGANSTDWVACRFEWCSDKNVDLYKAEKNFFLSCSFDRGYNYNISVNDCVVFISGGQITRGGRNDNFDSANIRMGGVSEIYLSNVKMEKGTDDGGIGSLTPKYAIYRNTTSKVYISNSNISDSWTVAFSNQKYPLININNTKGFRNVSGEGYIVSTLDGTTTTAQDTIISYVVKNYQIGNVYEIDIFVRVANTGTRIIEKLYFMIAREGGNAYITATKSDNLSANKINFSANSPTDLAIDILNVAPDGTTFDIAVSQVNTTNTYNLEVICKNL